MKKRILILIIVFILIIILIANIPQTNQKTKVFLIGNSLTKDTAEFSLDKNNIILEYHIQSGKPLNFIQENPNNLDPREQESKPYTIALKNNAYDAIIFQPFPGTNSTLSTDEKAILSFMDITNKTNNPLFYIHTTWTGHSNYNRYWKVSSSNTPNAKTDITEDYYNHLLTNLRKKTNNTIYLLPTGIVFSKLDTEIRNGNIENISEIKEFYRDGIHLSQLGRHIVRATLYSTITKEKPKNLEREYDSFDKNKIYSEQTIKQIEDVIWKTITDYPNTGIKAP